jgi:hypothetical protein
MKTVAIVGSGPCGIIAARKFLQSSHFEITIFEQSTQIGGLWRPGGPINPEMRTNQTKFSVAFSDLSWDTVDFDGVAAPIYPKAWQVCRYLNHYVKKYIPDELFRFNTKVMTIEKTPSQTGNEQPCRWRVTTKPTGSAADHPETEHFFDLLVVAPGAFSIPRKSSFHDAFDDSDSRIPIMHSTTYRFLSDIFFQKDASPEIPKNVVVVGGSHSGTEIASLLALQLSDARFSPPQGSANHFIPRKVNISHVASHELFALPSVFRDTSSKKCSFQPSDFVLYNRSNRPPEHPPSFTYELWNKEKSDRTREMGKSILSGGNDVSERGRVEGRPPIGVLGDMYTQFVTIGSITPIIGRLEALQQGDTVNTATASIRPLDEKDPVYHIDNVVAVIDATGFDSAAPLSMLSEDVKYDFGFDKTCSCAPLHITESYLCQNPGLPTIAVLGYHGAHWGTFEMQARAISQRWSQESIPERSESQQEASSKIAEYIDQLRAATKDHRAEEIPQNPFGDYVGLLEQASREMRLERLNLGCSNTSGPVCSARFIDPCADKAEAFKTMVDLEQVQIRAKESGLFIARAAFNGLLGEWTSALRVKDGGVRTMQLAFYPRHSTDRRFGWEYLVIERRPPREEDERQVYRYDESLDEISIWSVNAHDRMSAESKLFKLDFNRTERNGKDTAVASRVFVGQPEELGNVHVDSRFLFAGVTLEKFTLEVATSSGSIGTLHFVRMGSGYKA